MRLSTSGQEILEKLGSITTTDPVHFIIKKCYYLKESDQLFLDLEYSYFDFRDDDPQLRNFRRVTSRLYLQVLINNFSSQGLRSYEILKEAKNRFATKLGVLEDGSLSVYSYDGWDERKAHFYFLGRQENETVEQYELRGVKPYQMESCKILNKIGNNCLVSTETHFLSIDLETENIVSSIQFAGKFTYLNGSMNLSESIGQKELIFLAPLRGHASTASDTIDVLEIHKEKEFIETLNQIELAKLLQKLSKLTIHQLIGVIAFESSKKILLLAEVSYEEQTESSNQRKNSMVEIEYDYENPVTTRANLIETR